MNGLRIYTSSTNADTEQGIHHFYSRRGSGPYYEWGYDENLKTWRASRLSSLDVLTHPLDAARWKSLPRALMARLSEHYLD